MSTDGNEQEIRLAAIAAHARGDYEAERIALDRRALMERGEKQRMSTTDEDLRDQAASLIDMQREIAARCLDGTIPKVRQAARLIRRYLRNESQDTLLDALTVLDSIGNPFAAGTPQ